MQIDKYLWWILAISVFLSLIIMMIAWLISIKKIKNIQNKFNLNNAKDINNPIFSQKNYGKLLWNLKQKTKNPLPDLSLEFVINTCLRNKYKNFIILNFEENYEKINLQKRTFMILNEQKYDFVLINFNFSIFKNFNDIFNKLNNGGMIIIVNIVLKKFKNFFNELEEKKIKYEWKKINKGIILIVK